MRDISKGDQVFELGTDVPWIVIGPDGSGFECWRWSPDGKGARIQSVLQGNEFETHREREDRRNEEDRIAKEAEDRMMGKPRPKPKAPYEV